MTAPLTKKNNSVLCTSRNYCTRLGDQLYNYAYSVISYKCASMRTHVFVYAPPYPGWFAAVTDSREENEGPDTDERGSAA